MNGLLRLACGWHLGVGVDPHGGGPDVRSVVLTAQYDPEGIVPAGGVSVITLTVAEADQLADMLADAQRRI